MNSLAETIRSRLRARADEKFRKGVFAFFKENVRPIGVPMPICRKIAIQALGESAGAAKKEVFEACKALFAGGFIEEAMAATVLLEELTGGFEESDFAALEKFLGEYVDNWAVCDGLCNHAIGGIFEKFPKLAKKSRKWAGSKNRWLRRASVVSFVLPARHGKFHDVLLSNAEKIIYDGDDLVRKGTGWALREAAKADEKRVTAFLLAHADMPRVTIRYAIERMPKEKRMRLMSAGRPPGKIRKAGRKP
jgi:3-methyladenine DNA glycosylase AlkD